ncbi:hypothetical protein PZA11_002104 [Diplocarpon coronariae]
MPSPFHQLHSDVSGTPGAAALYRAPTRTSTSSDDASSSASSPASSSYSSGSSVRYFMEASRPRVELMRCSRCTKCVETVVSAVRLVSTDDAEASGMVRFGHNLYYCDRCARMVGYK